MEILLSFIYIWWFYIYLDDLPKPMKAAFERKTMAWLASCFVVTLALGMLHVVCLNRKLRLLDDNLETLSYAIKLKLEFAVLNRLTKVTETKRMILAQGNWTSGLPITTAPPYLYEVSEFTSAHESMRTISPSLDKEEVIVSATDQLERLYLGGFEVKE